MTTEATDDWGKEIRSPQAEKRVSYDGLTF